MTTKRPLLLLVLLLLQSWARIQQSLWEAVLGLVAQLLVPAEEEAAWSLLHLEICCRVVDVEALLRAWLQQ